MKRILFLAAAVALTIGCAPNLTTQTRRQDYLQSRVDDNVEKAFGCDRVTLRFQRTEQRSGDWYDYYTAEGCGRRSDYVTRVSQQDNGKYTTWAFGAVPAEAQYASAAEQQLSKTAHFDLACDGQLELVTLKAAIDPMRMGYRATVGAKGCGKQSSYEVTCGSGGFVGGKHEITCMSVASAASSKP